MDNPTNFMVGKVTDDLSTLRSNYRDKARENDVEFTSEDLEDFESEVMNAREEAQDEGIDMDDKEAIGEFFRNVFGEEPDAEENQDSEDSMDEPDEDFDYWSRVDDTDYVFEWRHDNQDVQVVVERTGDTSWSARVIESGDVTEEIVEDMLDPQKAMFRAIAWIEDNDEKFEDESEEDKNESEDSGSDSEVVLLDDVKGLGSAGSIVAVDNEIKTSLQNDDAISMNEFSRVVLEDRDYARVNNDGELYEFYFGDYTVELRAEDGEFVMVGEIIQDYNDDNPDAKFKKKDKVSHQDFSDAINSFDGKTAIRTDNKYLVTSTFSKFERYTEEEEEDDENEVEVDDDLQDAIVNVVKRGHKKGREGMTKGAIKGRVESQELNEEVSDGDMDEALEVLLRDGVMFEPKKDHYALVGVEVADDEESFNPETIPYAVFKGRSDDLIHRYEGFHVEDGELQVDDLQEYSTFNRKLVVEADDLKFEVLYRHNWKIRILESGSVDYDVVTPDDLGREGKLLNMVGEKDFMDLVEESDLYFTTGYDDDEMIFIWDDVSLSWNVEDDDYSGQPFSSEYISRLYDDFEERAVDEFVEYVAEGWFENRENYSEVKEAFRGWKEENFSAGSDGSKSEVDYNDLFSKISSDVSGDQREFAENVLEIVDKYDLDKDVKIADDLIVENTSGLKYASVQFRSGKVVGFQYNPKKYNDASSRQRTHTVFHEASHFLYKRHNRDFYDQLIDILESEGMWNDEAQKFVEEDIRTNADYLTPSSIFDDYDGLTQERADSFIGKYNKMRGLVERDFETDRWEGLSGSIVITGEGNTYQVLVGRGRGKSRLVIADLDLRNREFSVKESEYWVYIESIDKDGNIEFGKLSTDFAKASEQLENSQERVKDARRERRFAKKSMDEDAVSELTSMGIMVSKKGGKLLNEDIVKQIKDLESPPMYVNPDVVSFVKHGIRSNDIKYDNIRMTGSIPRFLGTDGEYYGAFDGGETLTLPESNAEILVNRGNAKYINESSDEEEKSIDRIVKVGDNKVDDVFQDYHNLVNMGVKDLNKRLEGSCRKKASGSDRDEHIRRNKFILNTDKSDWGEEKVPKKFALDPDDSPAKSRLVVHQAERTVQFGKRHLGQLKNESIVIDEDGCFNPRVEGLRNWAIDPMMIEGFSVDEDMRES